MKHVLLYLLLVIAGNANSQNQTFSFAFKPGGGMSICNTVDNNGNHYVAGYFTTNADFDPGPGVTTLSSAGLSDVFISKYDANGNLLWAKSVGGWDNETVTGIAVDAQGNVITCGYFFSSAADFNPGSGSFTMTAQNFGSNDDVFVLKLDANGNFVWAKQITGPYIERIDGLAVDGSGNIILAGVVSGNPVDVDPGPGTYTIGTSNAFPYTADAYILKLNAAGNFVWVKQFIEPTDNQYCYAVATDYAGNIYASGYYTLIGSMDFDPGPGQVFLNPAGGYDNFLTKMDPFGNLLWARSMGGGTLQNSPTLHYNLNNLCVDSAGNAIVGGRFLNATANFGTLSINNGNTGQVFITKLDTQGNFVWATDAGGEIVRCITLDKLGNIYFTGEFSQQEDFDPSANTFYLNSSNFSPDIFLTKLNSAGSFIYTKQFGGQWSDIGSSVAVDKNNAVYVGGSYEYQADFDPGPAVFTLGGPGVQIGYIVKLTTCPNLSLSLSAADPYTVCSTGGNSISVASSNTVVWYNAINSTQALGTGTALLLDSMSAGIYTLYAVASNTCDQSNYFPVTFTVEPAPQLSITATPQALCEGEPLILLASGAISYTWNAGQQSATLNVPAALSNAGYSVIGTAANTCTNLAVLTLFTDPCAGISKQQQTENNFIIYPNPAATILNVETKAASGLLTIQDLSGRILKEVLIPVGLSAIDLSDFSKGSYIISLNQSPAMLTRKLLMKD